MKLLLRVILAVVSAVAFFYFTFWLGAGLIRSGPPSRQFTFISSLVAAAAAASLSWLLTRSSARGFFTSVLLGAIATGGVFFVAGFFGPMLFAPGSNQGPLLGLLLTGPLGFVLGAIGGAVYWFVRRLRSHSHSDRGAV